MELYTAFYPRANNRFGSLSTGTEPGDSRHSEESDEVEAAHSTARGADRSEAVGNGREDEM